MNLQRQQRAMPGVKARKVPPCTSPATDNIKSYTGAFTSILSIEFPLIICEHCFATVGYYGLKCALSKPLRWGCK